ncbi:hypothetical protein SPPR111872_02490 [Sphingobacterium prati]
MVRTTFLVYVILLRNKRQRGLFTRNNPIEFKQRTLIRTMTEKIFTDEK